MTVTAKLVAELRDRTGCGMMECKRALVEAGGDIEAAVEAMRTAGQAKADKRADRVAAEGVMVSARSADGKTAVLVEINTETDFSARDEELLGFAHKVVELALKSGATDAETLSNEMLPEGVTIEQARQAVISKIGENIKIRRMQKAHSADGMVGSYLHGSRIGVLVSMKNGNDVLVKDVAMHIAALRPLVVSGAQVSAEQIALERKIFTAQALESGKPEAIIEKMIEGRINKFIDEVSLLGQPFVKNPDIKVQQLLKEQNAEVLSFVRWEVGEGIEKKVDNFVEQVMAQARE